MVAFAQQFDALGRWTQLVANRTRRVNISDGTATEYAWDHRNRLTKVTFNDAVGTPTKIVEYAYDFGNRWVRKTLDTDADGSPDTTTVFIPDDNQIVLQYADGSLESRYLWNPAGVDQLLADEQLTPSATVLWTLTDHLGTVRDLIDSTGQTIDHLTYDSFGNVTSETVPTTRNLHLFTGKPFDPDTGLQNNINRWYDLGTGRWVSEDPAKFAAGERNMYRYVGNAATSRTDPSGLIDVAKGELTPTGGGSPDPDRQVNKFGAKYTFSDWFPSQPFTMAQRVKLNGEFAIKFLCQDSGGNYTVNGQGFVKWEEDYVEAWVRGNNPGAAGSFSFKDSHLFGPKKPALALAGIFQVGDSPKSREFHYDPSRGELVLQDPRNPNTTQLEPDYIVTEWSLTMSAEFEMFNGNWTQGWSPQFSANAATFAGAVRNNYSVSAGGTIGDSFFFAIPPDLKLSSILFPSRAGLGGMNVPPSNPGKPPWVSPSGAFRAKSSDKWNMSWKRGDDQPTWTYQGNYK